MGPVFATLARRAPARMAALAFFMGLGTVVDAAACRQWRAGGGWTILQDNGVDVRVDFQQEGDLLTGNGAFFGRVVDPTQQNLPNSTGSRHYTGQIDATISGDTIDMRIFWMPGMVGVYRGSINELGQASGEHWDRDRPDRRIKWRSSIRFRCPAPGLATD